MSIPKQELKFILSKKRKTGECNQESRQIDHFLLHGLCHSPCKGDGFLSPSLFLPLLGKRHSAAFRPGINRQFSLISVSHVPVYTRAEFGPQRFNENLSENSIRS